jgi:DNA-binding NarL/FixJ family response regulator
MTEVRSLRIVVVDDSVLFRAGMVHLLTDEGFEVVGQAGDPDGAIATVARESPDVVVLDIRMPPTHRTEGLEAAFTIRKRDASVAILLLSAHVEARHAMRLLQDGQAGVGYLLKDRVMRESELADAIRRVAAGGSVIDPELVAELLGPARSRDPIDELTPREREVLELMAEGRSNQSIADELVLEPKTIEGHIRMVFSKLGLEPEPSTHRRVLAVLAFLRDGPAARDPG